MILAGYRIERALGTGGMGTVYLAQHPRLPRKDAVKVLSRAHTGDEEFEARFLREAEIAARLHHPNLVAVRDRGEDDGRLWIAMQYVEGVDLAELMRRDLSSLTVDRAVRILTEAAAGLDELHRAGLLHRDVKPANILIEERPGGPDRVLVTDFGIARPADDSTTLAGPGGLSATLAYVAPEQIAGGPVDRRADVYALGCTLFQMLTGSVPFPRDDPGAVMYAHLNDPPPRPSQRTTGLPPALDAVVARAMAKRPGDRYDSCGELAAAARAALAGDVRRRRPRVLLIAAAVVIAVAVGVTIDRLAATPPRALPSDQPVTGTIEPAAWGAYAPIAEAFPDLLPPIPYGTGYQELTGCMPMTDKGVAVPLDTRVQVAHLLCVGNLDPVHSVEMTCNMDRSPIGPTRSVARVEGDERWTRDSGTGHLFWGTQDFTPGGADARLDGRGQGVIDVTFDSPRRNFCVLRVYGDVATGAQMRERWWPGAPL
ncbi:putative serine/threonine protein kinase [Nocardia nova SH22a]|uniref:non-specific serine/threonine protein kinase n=2 Tax=Nocardia nova TaxID=37330 RepID=W5TBS2_9NOCA|nr:putative serine/threonine protein kinase [Nocardia nova SH22a]